MLIELTIAGAIAGHFGAGYACAAPVARRAYQQKYAYDRRYYSTLYGEDTCRQRALSAMKGPWYGCLIFGYLTAVVIAVLWLHDRLYAPMLQRTLVRAVPEHADYVARQRVKELEAQLDQLHRQVGVRPLER